MNKGELIEKLSGRLGDHKTSSAALDAVVSEIQDAVRDGDKVNITGFGVFEARERAARTGRNPQTGEEIHVNKTTVPAFRAGATFKDLVSPSSGGRSRPQARQSRSQVSTKSQASAQRSARQAGTKQASAKQAGSRQQPGTRQASSRPQAGTQRGTRQAGARRGQAEPAVGSWTIAEEVMPRAQSQPRAGRQSRGSSRAVDGW